jgi:hypothetical protein
MGTFEGVGSGIVAERSKSAISLITVIGKPYLS